MSGALRDLVVGLATELRDLVLLEHANHALTDRSSEAALLDELHGAPR